MHGRMRRMPCQESLGAGAAISTDLLQHTSKEPSYESTQKIDRMATLLSKKLGPEYLSSRAGAGGAKMTYIEGWRVMALANEVFGFNGWSTEIKDLHLDFCDLNQESQRYSAAVTATVRITLADGCYHEDVGCGKIDNCKSKGDALDKIKKEAVTDATKRALRSFGNLLGNCLYDKGFLENIGKVKIPPKPKLDFSELHRPGQTYHASGSEVAGYADTIPVVGLTEPVNGPCNKGPHISGNIRPQPLQQPSRKDLYQHQHHHVPQEHLQSAAAFAKSHAGKVAATVGSVAMLANTGIRAEQSEESYEEFFMEYEEEQVGETAADPIYDDSGFLDVIPQADIKSENHNTTRGGLDQCTLNHQQHRRAIQPIPGPYLHANAEARKPSQEINRQAGQSPKLSAYPNQITRPVVQQDQHQRHLSAARFIRQPLLPKKAPHPQVQAPTLPPGIPSWPASPAVTLLQPGPPASPCLPSLFKDLSKAACSKSSIVDTFSDGFGSLPEGGVPETVTFESARKVKRVYEEELDFSHDTEQTSPPPPVDAADNIRPIERARMAQHQQQEIRRKKDEAMAKRQRVMAEREATSGGANGSAGKAAML